MRLITFLSPDLQVEQVEEMVQEGKYKNKSELIREAIAAFLVNEKTDIRTKRFDDLIENLELLERKMSGKVLDRTISSEETSQLFDEIEDFLSSIEDHSLRIIRQVLEGSANTAMIQLLRLKEIFYEKTTAKTEKGFLGKIDALFYQGYFEEFLEELDEKEPELFAQYVKQQSRPREKKELEQ